MWEVRLTLTIKTPEWRRSGVLIIYFEQISHIVLVFSIADFEQVNVGWVEWIYWICNSCDSI